MDINGMTVVVSGGASGLGKGTSRYLVEKGARVSILDMDDSKGMQLVAELGEAAMFYKTNVADAESVQAAVDQTCQRFGSIHGAISCAGVAGTGRILTKNGSMDMASFNKVIQINLIGTMNIIRSTAEKMVNNEPNADGERGVLINTASAAAYEGQQGQAAYSASKAGIIGMTLPIAKEFACYGIRVMTIAPGLFETPMLNDLPPEVIDGLIRMLPFPKRMGTAREFGMSCGQIIENPMFNGRTVRLDGALTMI